MPTLKTLLAGALLACAGAATAGEPVTAGAILAHNCFTCHGPQGKSPGSIPSLAGRDAEYIGNAMRQFRSGERPATVMNRHAKGYTDEEITAIANHIAGLTARGTR